MLAGTFRSLINGYEVKTKCLSSRSGISRANAKISSCAVDIVIQSSSCSAYRGNYNMGRAAELLREFDAHKAACPR